MTLSATEQPISTKDATSKCFLDMLSVFAEFETNLRKERQMEGIAKAKEKGVYKGRKPSVDVQKVKELRDSGTGASAIAKELGIGRASVYRALTTIMRHDGKDMRTIILSFISFICLFNQAQSISNGVNSDFNLALIPLCKISSSFGQNANR